MSDNLKTWPERIYMQHTDDDEPMPFNEASRHEEAVTWCDVRQFKADVEYVRADLAAAGPGAVPDGWKLVPVTPTQEMCQVAQWKLREWPRYPFRVSPVYQAMLEAAPAAPVAAAAPGADERKPKAWMSDNGFLISAAQKATARDKGDIWHLGYNRPLYE